MSLRRVPVPRLHFVSQPRSGYTRIPTDERCAAYIEGVALAGAIFNVSVRGLYLVIDPPPTIGQRLRVSFCLPADTTPIACDARVAWRNPPSLILTGIGSSAMGLPPGCGLEFMRIEDADHQRVAAYVKGTFSAASPR
jgi:hypothetical protein